MAAKDDGYLPGEKALVEIKMANYFVKREWGDAFTSIKSSPLISDIIGISSKP